MHGATSTSEQPFVEKRLDGLSMFSMIIVIIKIMLGTYGMKLGYVFRCGVINALVINGIVALASYTAMMLYLKCAVYYECSTFEEIWTKSISRRTAPIQGFISLYESVGFIMLYLNQITELYRDFLYTISTDFPTLIYTEYIPLLVVFLIYYIPTNMTLSFKAVTGSSYVATLIYLFLIAHVIYWFVIRYKQNGFDPRNEIVYSRFGTITIECFSALSVSYGFVPLVYPGLRHLKNPTYSRWKTVFGVIHLGSFLMYSLLGIFGYFTFFDEANGELNIMLYPKVPIVQACFVLTIIMVLLTTIVSINSAKFLLFSTFTNTSTVSKKYMRVCGIAIIVISMFGSTLPGYIFSWFSYLNELILIYLEFILPSVFYLRLPSGYTAWLKVASVIIFLFGFLCAGFSTYLTVSPYFST